MRIKETSCGVVVVYEGRMREYLLLKYPEGHWDLPKGHREGNESYKETAARELLEETGLKNVTFVPGFRERIVYLVGEGRWWKQVFFFLVITRQRAVVLSHEHVGFRWLPFAAAIRRMTYQSARGVLAKAEVVAGQRTMRAT